MNAPHRAALPQSNVQSLKTLQTLKRLKDPSTRSVSSAVIFNLRGLLNKCWGLNFVSILATYKTMVHF